MANATLRDLSADTDIGATDVMPKQATSGGLKKITGTNIKASLQSGGGIALSLAAAQVAAAGADTRVQYANGTARGGDAEVTWDNSGKALTVGAVTATTQMVLPSSVDVSTPTLAFGNGNTGLFEGGDVLNFVTGALSPLRVSSTRMFTASGGSLADEAASSTNPTLLPAQNDTDTGVGTGTADTLSLIAGGVEMARGVEAATDFLAIYSPPKNKDPRLSAVPASFMFMMIDETLNKLDFWVKYADGVAIKSHSLALA